MTDSDNDALFGKDLRVYDTKMNKQSLPDIIKIDGVKYQKVKEPKEVKTLEQMLDDKKYFPDRCDTMCDIVERWMSQFHPHDMSFENLSYCNGFFDAIEALRSNLYD